MTRVPRGQGARHFAPSNATVAPKSAADLIPPPISAENQQRADATKLEQRMENGSRRRKRHRLAMFIQ